MPNAKTSLFRFNITAQYTFKWKETMRVCVSYKGEDILSIVKMNSEPSRSYWILYLWELDTSDWRRYIRHKNEDPTREHKRKEEKI
jgi:hypothetical protein